MSPCSHQGDFSDVPGLAVRLGYELADRSVAGGITAENVGELLRHRPYGIDVSSGVEASPGVKDAGALRALFERIAASPTTQSGVGVRP